MSSNTKQLRRGVGGGEFIKTLDANSISSLSVYLPKLRRIPAKNFEINKTLICRYIAIAVYCSVKFCNGVKMNYSQRTVRVLRWSEVAG